MMKKILLTMLSISLVFVSCTKEGTAGKDGANGKDGINGTDGKDGKDGTIVYSGNGVPSATVGKIGDYFMDLQNTKLYGPKTQSGWGNGFNLKGDNGKDGLNGKDGTNGLNGKDGINGTDGSTILSGYGIPSISVGRTGDYYLDKNSYLLYGPKMVSSWGPGLLLRGKDGINGIDGKDGRDGNANVRTYMFSNPWNYYYDEQPQSGFFRFFFGGSFYVNSFEAEYGLVLGFIESNSGTVSVWSQAGTTHSNYLGSNFNSSFQLAKSNGAMTGVFIKVGSNILRNDGATDWTDKQDAINRTSISRIKIVVIPQSSLSVLGYKKEQLSEKTIQAISYQFLNN